MQNLAKGLDTCREAKTIGADLRYPAGAVARRFCASPVNDGGPASLDQFRH